MAEENYRFVEEFRLFYTVKVDFNDILASNYSDRTHIIYTLVCLRGLRNRTPIFLARLTRLFLDTEFTELRQSARLLSLAIVAENDAWFYAECTEVDLSTLGNWHQEHIVPFLTLSKEQRAALPPDGCAVRGPASEIVPALRDWLSRYPEIEFWADVPAYDWVLFCELFGGAKQLPPHIHYIVRDLATFFLSKGLDPDTDRFQYAYGDNEPPAGLIRHQALGDARSGMACLLRLQSQNR